MHKNPVWLFLVSFILASMLWFAIPALYHLHEYYSLSETTTPTDISWFVEKIAAEDYRVGATYSFNIDNFTAKGETIFEDFIFRNPSSADDELKIKAAKKHLVFYDPQNIHHSSLQKKFPTKECISTGVLFLLFLYFIGLGIYTRVNSKI